MYRCQICFDELGTHGYIASTACGHIFCSECLQTAFRVGSASRHPACPACREPIDPRPRDVTAKEASEIIASLSKRFPAARDELQRLGPRPSKIFLDKDESVHPPDIPPTPNRRFEWQQAQIRRRDAEIASLTRELEDVDEQFDQTAVSILQEELAITERRLQAKEAQADYDAERMKRREAELYELYDAMVADRGAMETKCWEQEKELRNERKARLTNEKKVAHLESKLHDMHSDAADREEQAGKMANTLIKMQGRETRHKAAVQECRAERDKLENEVAALRRELAVERRQTGGAHGLSSKMHICHRSDEALEGSDEDASFDMVTVDDTDDDGFDDEMITLSLGSKRRRGDLPSHLDQQRDRKTKLIPMDAKPFVDRDGKWSNTAARGPRYRVLPPRP